MSLSADPLVRGNNILGEGPLCRRDFATYLACMGETDTGSLIAASGPGWLESRSEVWKVEEGLTISISIGWSPDTRIMYLTDSKDSVIYSYDFEATAGTIENIGENK